MSGDATITPITAAALLNLKAPDYTLQHTHDEAMETAQTLRSAPYLRTGIGSLDSELSSSGQQGSRGLWSAGKVIGLGNVSGSAGHGREQTVELSSSLSLPLEILATHLTDTISDNTTANPLSSALSSPSVFIITPPPLLGNSMQRLYSLITQRIRDQKQRQRYPRTYDQTRLVAADTATSARKADESADIQAQAETQLDRVSVLQYLDVPGLLESISEVRDAISLSPPTASPVSPAILLLLGLSQTLSNTYTRYGLVRTAALLSGVLSGLRELSRTVTASQPSTTTTNPRPVSSPLVLVDLDIAYTASGSGGGGSRSNTRHGSGESSGLETAFASASEKVMRVVPVGVLGRLVERAMDAVVAVHDGDGKIDTSIERRRIVEVVHDGIDGCFGRWAVWNPG